MSVASIRFHLAISTLVASFLSTPMAFSAASGIRNPLIRVCVVNQGTFEVQPNGPTDDIALCRFGPVVIDSQSLLSSLDTIFSQAANVILNDVIATQCQDLGANSSPMLNGQTLCRFSDGSALSLDAAKVGISDPNRLHLKSALSTR